MIYSIYIIENNVNDKVYIGYTKRTIECRFKQHLYSSKNPSIKNKLYYAMRKYGCDCFSVRVIDCTKNKEEIFELEKKYVLKYDSYNNGYNSTVGGERLIGKDNPMYGKSANKGKKFENTDKYKSAAIKRWGNKEYRELQAKNHMKKHSEETKKKLSISAKKRGATYTRKTIINGVVYNSRKEACEKLGKTYQQLHYKGEFT